MWRRASARLHTVAVGLRGRAAAGAPRGRSLASVPSPQSPTASAFQEAAPIFPSDSGSASLKIATGHEREEIEAELQGKKRFDMDAPTGPFGTKNCRHIEGGEGGLKVEHTLTRTVAFVCSFLVERVLHLLDKALKKKHKALFSALRRVNERRVDVGGFQLAADGGVRGGPERICIPERLTQHMLPFGSIHTENRTVLLFLPGYRSGVRDLHLAWKFLEAPAVVQSFYDKRIVGCPGGEGEDEHDVVWFWLEKDKPHECPVCSQYFTLEVIGPGGPPDGHGDDHH